MTRFESHAVSQNVLFTSWNSAEIGPWDP